MLASGSNSLDIDVEVIIVCENSDKTHTESGNGSDQHLQKRIVMLNTTNLKFLEYQSR